MQTCVIVSQTEEAQAESVERKAGRRASTKAGLYAIMACMRDVRVRTERTDAMFPPLHETIAVLHKYGIQVRFEALCTLNGCLQIACSLSISSAQTSVNTVHSTLLVATSAA